MCGGRSLSRRRIGFVWAAARSSCARVASSSSMLAIGLVDRDRHSVDCLDKWGAVVDMCVSMAASALLPGFWAAFFPFASSGLSCSRFFGIPVLLFQACGFSFLRIITRRMAEAFVLVGERITAKKFRQQVLEPMSNRSPPQSLTKQGGLAGRV